MLRQGSPLLPRTRPASYAPPRSTTSGPLPPTGHPWGMRRRRRGCEAPNGAGKVTSRWPSTAERPREPAPAGTDEADVARDVGEGAARCRRMDVNEAHREGRARRCRLPAPLRARRGRLQEAAELASRPSPSRPPARRPGCAGILPRVPPAHAWHGARELRSLLKADTAVEQVDID